MEIENLIRLRNYIVTTEGSLLLDFLSDYITENSCKAREASEIKGMCELLHQIKTIPSKVEQLRRK
jgi:hypothetical protein